MSRVPYFRDVALIDGFAAYVLGKILRAEIRTGALTRLRIPEGDRWDECERAVYALERAGKAWTDRVRTETQEPAVTSTFPAGRKPDGVPAETAAASKHGDDIDAREAAELLGVGERRVRQLAGELGGWRDASGRWWFSRAAVVAYREAS